MRPQVRVTELYMMQAADSDALSSCDFSSAMTIDKRAALRRLQVPQKDEEAAVWETSRWVGSQ